MKQMLESLNIDYDTLEALPNGMWRLGGRGEVLLDAWFVLNRQKQTTGYSPILTGDLQSQELIWEIFDRNTSPEEIEARSRLLEGKTILEERWKGNLDFSDTKDPEELEMQQGLIQGDTSALIVDPRAVKMDNVFAVWDYKTGSFATNCFLLLLPNTDETTVHAYLRYGGWNAYPTAEEHLAILRYWREKHGATLVALTSDTLELRLEQPISDPQVALELAREHYAYTPDAVEQGAGSIQELAQEILNTNVWFFWWD